MGCTLEDLYTSFRGKLRAFVASRTRDDDLADDLVQEAFVKVTAHCRAGRDCAKPKAFLYKITMNVIADHFRQPGTKTGLALAPLDDAAHPAPDRTAGPVADDEPDKDFLNCLTPLVDSLPEPFREAVRLADLENVPQQVIARRLGLSLSGAKSRIQRGRLKLRDSILNVCAIEHDRYGQITRCEPRR